MGIGTRRSHATSHFTCVLQHHVSAAQFSSAHVAATCSLLSFDGKARLAQVLCATIQRSDFTDLVYVIFRSVGHFLKVFA